MLMLLATTANAHEFTPTYPVFRNSYVDNVLVTTMKLFNKRQDVQYYEIGVFDAEWRTMEFATESRIIKVPYLSNKTFNVYIRKHDVDKVEYVCTRSKLKREDVQSTGISSKICSRVK